MSRTRSASKDSAGSDRKGSKDSGADESQKLRRTETRQMVRNSIEEMEKTGALKTFEGAKKNWVDGNVFGSFIGVMIMLNAIFMGFAVELNHCDPREGCDEDELTFEIDILWIIESIFCSIFVFEMIARMSVHHLRYFRDNWNIMDFILVMISVVDNWVLPFLAGPSSSVQGVTVLRTLRMLRLVKVVRAVRVFQELWLIVYGLFQSLKALTWVGILMMLWVYSWALVLVNVVGKNPSKFPVPTWDWSPEERWSTMPRAMFSLFQAMTLDNFFVVTQPIVDKEPVFIPCFIVFVLVGHFGLLNLIVGVLVETMVEAANENEEKILAQLEADRKRTLGHLATVFEIADVDGDGMLTMEELVNAFEYNQEVKELTEAVELDLSETEHLFQVLDEDGSGEVSIEEFFQGCLKLKGAAKNKDMIQLGVGLSMLVKKTIAVNSQLADYVGKADVVRNDVNRAIREASRICDMAPSRSAMPTLVPQSEYVPLQKVSLFPEDKKKLEQIAEHLGAALLPGRGSLPEHAAVHFLIDIWEGFAEVVSLQDALQNGQSTHTMAFPNNGKRPFTV